MAHFPLLLKNMVLLPTPVLAEARLGLIGRPDQHLAELLGGCFRLRSTAAAANICPNVGKLRIGTSWSETSNRKTILNVLLRIAETLHRLY